MGKIWDTHFLWKIRDTHFLWKIWDTHFLWKIWDTHFLEGRSRRIWDTHLLWNSDIRDPRSRAHWLSGPREKFAPAAAAALWERADSLNKYPRLARETQFRRRGAQGEHGAR